MFAGLADGLALGPPRTLLSYHSIVDVVSQEEERRGREQGLQYVTHSNCHSFRRPHLQSIVLRAAYGTRMCVLVDIRQQIGAACEVIDSGYMSDCICSPLLDDSHADETRHATKLALYYQCKTGTSYARETTEDKQQYLKPTQHPSTNHFLATSHLRHIRTGDPTMPS